MVQFYVRVKEFNHIWRMWHHMWLLSRHHVKCGSERKILSLTCLNGASTESVPLFLFQQIQHKTRNLQWKHTARCFAKWPWGVSGITFGFTIPAQCMVCMVSGVQFRDGTLAHWVTHSVGVSRHSGPQGRPLRGSCNPSHSPCLFGCVQEWAL